MGPPQRSTKHVPHLATGASISTRRRRTECGKKRASRRGRKEKNQGAHPGGVDVRQDGPRCDKNIVHKVTK